MSNRKRMFTVWTSSFFTPFCEKEKDVIIGKACAMPTMGTLYAQTGKEL